MGKLLRSLIAGSALLLPTEIQNERVVGQEPEAQDTDDKEESFDVTGEIRVQYTNAFSRKNHATMHIPGYGKAEISRILFERSKEDGNVLLSVHPSTQHPSFPDAFALVGLGTTMRELGKCTVNFLPEEAKQLPPLPKISPVEGASHPQPEFVQIELTVITVDGVLHHLRGMISTNIRHVFLGAESLTVEGKEEEDPVEFELPAPKREIHSIEVRQTYLQP